MDLKKIIQEFDQYLFCRGMSFHAVIVGGAALNLLAVTSRVTQDIDVMEPGLLPEKIKSYAIAFAAEKNIPADWLNRTS